MVAVTPGQELAWIQGQLAALRAELRDLNALIALDLGVRLKILDREEARRLLSRVHRGEDGIPRLVSEICHKRFFEEVQDDQGNRLERAGGARGAQ